MACARLWGMVRFAAILAAVLAASAPPSTSAADMPRLLSFVQYWSSLEARDEQAVNGCPTPVEGKPATGAYRAQLVFWLPDAPRDRLVKAWGALSLGWFVGRGGEVTSLVPLAFPLGAQGQSNPVRITDTNSKWPPLWHTGDPAPTNPIRFPSPTDGLVNRLLGGGLESKDRPLALLRLLCGWDGGEGLSHARIDAILGAPQAADITDVRDFLIPEEQGESLPDWWALLQRARDSKPPAFLSAGYLGDTVSDRHQALYRSFLARLEMTVPPATQPQTPIPAGPALQDAAKSPISPERPPHKPGPPKPDMSDMTWIWYALTVVGLVGLAAFAVFWIGRYGAGARWSRKDQEETGMDFYEELRRHSVDNINKMTDAVRVLGLAQENIAERLAGLEARFSEGGAVPDGASLRMALNEASTTGNARIGELWHVVTDIRTRLSAYEQRTSLDERAEPITVERPSAVGFVLSADAIARFETVLTLTDDGRRRLETTASGEELARRVAAELIPTAAAVETLERVDAWLAAATDGQAQLIIPAIGGRPSSDEAVEVMRRPIDRGISGAVTRVLRPGLRFGGAVQRKAEVELGV